jgi:hypothetical protein
MLIVEGLKRAREIRKKPEQMSNNVELQRSLTACMIRLANEKRMLASGFSRFVITQITR